MHTVSIDASPPFWWWIRWRVIRCRGWKIFTLAGQYQTIPLSISMQRYLLFGAICIQPLCSPIWIQPAIRQQSQSLPGVYEILIDSAKAWKHFIVGYTEAQFCMPYITPNLLTLLGFYQWYKTSNPSHQGSTSTHPKPSSFSNDWVESDGARSRKAS